MKFCRGGQQSERARKRSGKATDDISCKMEGIQTDTKGAADAIAGD